MLKELLGGSASYRVTLFVGPEPVQGTTTVVACVFNVKKRSWKAGIQVVVEIACEQVARLQQVLQPMDRLTRSLLAFDPAARSAYAQRIEELFVQAIAWCKLALRIERGLSQENQRIAATDLVVDVDRMVVARQTDIVAYILAELDLAPDQSSAFTA
ncbi:MAG: hypothetical protein NNA18_06280 [Nitrospira sp.]|nr:hypothetical protein [Nitrospira sp.]